MNELIFESTQRSTFLSDPQYRPVNLCLGRTHPNNGRQGPSQDLETGCQILAVVKFLGVQIFKGDHYILRFQPSTSGLEIKILSRKPECIFISFLKVFCMSNNTYLGSLQKFEGAAGAFKGALGSRHPLISSPEHV